jgi:ATP-dependent Clp endopeptidase proteolytic subunit ClpP
MIHKTIIDPKIKIKIHEAIHELIVIRLNKTFDEDMTEKFTKDFNKAIEINQKIIPIIIDSFGGSVYSLLEIISLIQSSPVPVATIVLGKAMSAGAMLFCFGNQGLRFMSPHATLMFHDVSGWSTGKVEEMKTSAKEADAINKKMFRLAAKQIGKDKNFFLTLLDKRKHAEIYMKADEALKLNISNHTGIPEIITSVMIEQNIILNGEILL